VTRWHLSVFMISKTVVKCFVRYDSSLCQYDTRFTGFQGENGSAGYKLEMIVFAVLFAVALAVIVAVGAAFLYRRAPS